MKASHSAGAIAALMAVSAQVSAQGGYIGAGAGQSFIRAPVSVPAGALNELEPYESIEAEIDTTAIGWKLFGGYRINDYFAIEGSWTDFGEPDDNAQGYEVSVETDGMEVTGLGILPIKDKFEMFAKLGLFVWQARYLIEGREFDSDNNIDYTLGVGAAFNINPSFTIRGELQTYGIDKMDESSFLSFSVVYNL